jgi:hypothetical protein
MASPCISRKTFPLLITGQKWFRNKPRRKQKVSLILKKPIPSKEQTKEKKGEGSPTLKEGILSTIQIKEGKRFPLS